MELNKVQESVSEQFVVSTFSLSSGTAQNLRVKIQKLSTRSIEFDLVSVDASIANALRRILIAEVWIFVAVPDAPLRWAAGSDSCDRICIRMEQYLRHRRRSLFAPTWIDPLERGPSPTGDERESQRPGNRPQYDCLQTPGRVYAQHRRASRLRGSCSPLQQLGSTS